MRKLFLIAMVVLVFPVLAAGQNPAESGDALKDQLISLEKQSWEAWKNRDGNFYKTFLSDDHVEVGAGGVSTKDEIVPFVGSPVCVIKSYSVDSFSFTLFDANTAMLTYHAAQDTTCHGKLVPSPAWVSSMYVKRGGRWLNAYYQQSSAGK